MSDVGEIEVTLTAGPVAAAVLRRVVGAVAAQAELPIDRIQDATLVMDTLLGALAADKVSAVFVPREQGIEIAVGPLMDGEGARLLSQIELPDPGPIVRGLSDRVWIDGEGRPQEYVCVLIGRSAAR